MSDDSSRPKVRGAVPMPAHVQPRDERKLREQAAVADLEARLRSGDITPEDADAEILELALERFSFLPPDELAGLRELGREIFEEPELIETRRFAPRPPRNGEGP